MNSNVLLILHLLTSALINRFHSASGFPASALGGLRVLDGSKSLVAALM
jgi:hypothetical protein